MAQLNDTMVQGDLRTTGAIYGTFAAVNVDNANLAIPMLTLGDNVGSTGDFFIGSGSGKNLPNTSDNFNIHTTVTHFTGTTYRLSQIATPTSSTQPTGIYERCGISSDGVSWTFSSWMSTTNTSQYLPLSGGTMTGQINAWGGQYNDSYTSYALNMGNSNIVGLNALYTADAADTASEGIHFYRDTTHTDTLWIAGGHMYFVPNRTLVGTGSSTSAANSKKVAILPASITSGHVVVTDGTSGDVTGVAASSLTVGTATTQYHGYAEFSNKTNAYGLLATIDTSGMGGNWDIHAIFSIQHIQDTSVNYLGDQKLIVDIRTNGDATSFSYYATNLNRGTNNRDYSIRMYRDSNYTNVRIYAYGGTANAYGSVIVRLESCTNWFGTSLVSRITLNRGTADTTTPTGTSLTVTEREFLGPNLTLPNSGATDTYISCGVDDYKRAYLDVTNESGSKKAGIYTRWGTSSNPHSQWLCYTDENGKGFFKGIADTAAHLGSYGTALEWPYPSSSGKPYALLANKGVGTNTNWGFGQLFKLEVANAFAIFKVSVRGNSSAVVEARTDVLYFCNMTRAQLEQILVVRYGFTANTVTNGAIVAIYADMSKVVNLLSTYTRATLRQLDNQSDGQYAYEHWNSFTFFTNEMVASAGGAAPTMNVMYYTKAEIDGAFSVVNNNITSLTQPIRFMIAYPQKITVYSESMVLINEYTNTSSQFSIQTTLDYAKTNYVKKIHMIVEPSASGTSTIYMQSTGTRNAQFFDKSRYELTIQNISGNSLTIRIQVGGRLDSTGYYDCWNINHDGVVDSWINFQDNLNTHFHELGTISGHNCKSWEIVIPSVNVGSNWNTVHMDIATLR